jgi:magnesium-transporting ATPase (P-type)
MRLLAVEPLDGRRDVSDVLAAVVAAEKEDNATNRAITARYDRPPEWAVTQRVPFSSARKWSGVVFADHGTWLLGAPSVVGGASVPAAVQRYEEAGQRVLLLAAASGPLDGDRLPAGVAPVALLVLAEELRDEASGTVRYLTEQGVRIKVLSGDAPVAVGAIASRAAVPVTRPPCDASRLGDDEIGDWIERADVFGRVRPAQKLAAVRALQSAGHVVAMVGDGVNDVPALKQADLGIAMGSGSDASRGVARVVLLDDSFGAVPRLLGEARRVIANIERVARLFVTKTVYAAIIAVLVGVIGFAYPFYPRHLTIISTLTIGVPGFFLALAVGEPRAHPGFTGRVMTFTVPAGIAAAFAALVSYGLARATSGLTAEASRTVVMLALIAVGLWVIVLVAPSPLWRLGLVFPMAACLIPLFAIPWARSVFAVRLPPWSLGLQVAAVTLAAIVALTAWTRWRRRPVPPSRPALAPGSGASPGPGAGVSVNRRC